jgi:hypothetical protein
MIQRFVDAWDKARVAARDELMLGHPDSYEKLFELVIRHVSSNLDDDYMAPDASRITRIDHGDCQGSLVFVVGCSGYQPSRYWGCVVDYGSCSGCDTLEGIRGYSYQAVTDKQASEYMQLCLNMVQWLKPLHTGEQEVK